MSHSTHPAASRRLFAVKQKLYKVIAPAACFVLAALAAACGLATAPAGRQANGDATRQSALAPGASASPQGGPTNAPANAPAAGGESPLPAPSGMVNDYAKVFDDAARAQLEEKLKQVKERGKIEFAVATIESTGGREIKDYSLAVARGWGVGSKETGDGLLLLLAVQDRRWQVQVSRSLEPTLPDDAVGEICRSATQLYREGRYAEGMTRCVDGLVARLIEKKRFKLE